MCRKGKKDMKTNKTKKPYKIETTDGKLTVRMLEKGVDGRYHSYVAYTPCVKQVDGKKVKLTRKQLVSEALAEMLPYYPNLTK